MDPVAAILVALMIIKAAYDLTLESAKDLMDVGLPAQEVAWIKDLIEGHGPRSTDSISCVPARPDTSVIEFHLKVDPNQSVATSHAITEDLTGHVGRTSPIQAS